MWWVKVFVILCLVLDLTSSVSYYRRITHKHRHRHVYKCGYQKCVRRKSPPVCKQWCLMYVNVGYCQQVRYVCCSFKEKPGYCSPSQNVCAWPFPYYLTQAYQCQHDFNCPSEYKCCYDSCYVHKVCKPCVNPQGTPSTYPPKEGETTTSGFEKETTVTTTTSPITTTTELTTTTTSTTTRETTIPTEETTVQEETTTTSTTIQESTTREETTTEEVTTTQETTTQKEVTTIAQKTTQEEVTTSKMSTTEKPVTTTLTTTTLRTTTIEEIEGSGFGSGDTEIPEPPAARRWQRNDFDAFSDDEDFFNDVMDFN